MSKMLTPKLSQKALNSTLSAKKSKKKETIKNVLASPYETYWPKLSGPESETIKSSLQHHLPRLVFDQVKVPWSELRKVPRAERKAYKENFRKSKPNGEEVPGKPNRDGFILGINDITKSLENHSAKAVLITSDARPKLMVKHVIAQAVLLNIPVLVVVGLREIVKQACGINSVAIAFTQNPRYEAVIHEIYDIAQQYPVTDKHMNFNRSRENPKEMESVVILDDTSDVLSKTPETIDLEKTYLKRTGPHNRVFLPGGDSATPMEGLTGFLSLTTDTSSTREKFLLNYKSLKVKRIQGDPNRRKRKIEEIKKMVKIRKGKVSDINRS